MQSKPKIDYSLGLYHSGYAWKGLSAYADMTPYEAMLDAEAIWPAGYWYWNGRYEKRGYPPLNCAISAEWARQRAAMTGMLNELEGRLQEFGNW